MFNGETREKKKIDLRGKSKKEDKAQFLERTGREREQRKHDREQNEASMTIQKAYRRSLLLRSMKSELLSRWRARFDVVPAPAMTLGDLSYMIKLLYYHMNPALEEDQSKVLRTASSVCGRVTTKDRKDFWVSRVGDVGSWWECCVELCRVCEMMCAVMEALDWDSSKSMVVEMMKMMLVLSDVNMWPIVSTMEVAAQQPIKEMVNRVLTKLILSGRVCAGVGRMLSGVEKGGVGATMGASLALRTIANSSFDESIQNKAADAFLEHILGVSELLKQLPSVLHKPLQHESIWGPLTRAIIRSSSSSSSSSPSFASRLGNVVEIWTGELNGTTSQLNVDIFLECVGILFKKVPQRSIGSSSSLNRQLEPLQQGQVICELAIKITKAGDEEAKILRNRKTRENFGLSKELLGKAVRNKTLLEVNRNVVCMCETYCAILENYQSRAVGVLNALAFDSPIPVLLWNWMKCSKILDLFLSGDLGDKMAGSRLGLSPQSSGIAALGCVMTIFARSFGHLLMVTDDEEFYEKQVPFPLAELVDMSLLLRQYCSRRFWGLNASSSLPSSSSSSLSESSHREAVTRLMNLLYDRNSRREFCGIEYWIERGMRLETFSLDPSTADPRSLLIMREFPHIVPFEERVSTFQRLLHEDRFRTPKTEIRVRIRRSHVVQDGYAALGHAGEALKGDVRIHFINESGLDEAGIDLGGVYKEFLNTLIEQGFHPKFGLFCMSEDNMLYPNPQSHRIVGGHLDFFTFLGRMLGKAMWDNIQVDLPFCDFFLAKLLGKHNYLDELPSLDRTLYKNLLFVKHYDGDVEDLSLDFTTTSDDLGVTHVHELIPGGSNIRVTNDNKVQYVHLMADFRLNKQIKPQCDAFVKGFETFVPRDRLRFFNAKELQIVIRGVEKEIDVDDMERHVTFSGGYHRYSGTIRRFFNVLRTLSPQDQRLTLKFITSCPRPPLLGFGQIQPPIVIHKVPSSRGFFSFKEEDRLPTASTCMNLLKLPPYKSEDGLRAKLLYAIHSGAGFELS